MDRAYWELMHRVLCQYGFSVDESRTLVREAKNGDEYALSVCLLISKLEPQE